MADGDLGPGIPQVLSHYRLIRRLGTGGMGAVFEAQDRRDESRVAVKLLHPHLATDESFRERFEREAHVAALLRSPYTVKLLDYGNAEGYFYLVMEYIDGQSVAQLIERQGRVDPKRALSITADAARALEEAEARGVVHRDIKPDNILLGEHESVKVADFGIARRAGSGGDLTTAGGFIGTTTYAAPEQGESNEVDHRADIYALGATLYCMLAGQPPFRADSPFEVLRQHREATLPMGPLAGYPDSVVNIVRRCMEKDPADRYESATQLVGALERAQRALSSTGGTVAGAAATFAPAAAAATPSAALDITQVATPSGAIASRTSGGMAETAVGIGAGAGAPPPPPSVATPGGTSGAGKRRGLLMAVAGIAGVAVIGTVAAVFVAGGGGDNKAGDDDDDAPSSAQQTREVKTATARAHATRDAKTEAAGEETPSPSTSSTASSASSSTTPSSSATRAASAVVPPATSTTRPPTATPVPPFIVSGEWTYGFYATQNTCGSGSEVGDFWEVVLTYKDANGDGRIYAGEQVTVVDTGQTGNTVGTYTFTYPKFVFQAGLVDGDFVLVTNTFSSDSSGSAVREDHYTVNGQKCVIVYED